ncbi:DUF4209 domain-containing protein [Coprobacter fastidiosus]|uniref:DUF4209 domain-containing protein n=1 Tax=Coprobacter fastidiosus TaxID=1099853 RepID=UPI000240EAE2|nr:DUF4209 domain-containing protein [Coprobacter fastidiosus]EHL86695.1 hypothetical protein HMPREF1033_01358 [Tannerella sp. 6_1_58FAA_CT1]
MNENIHAFYKKIESKYKVKNDFLDLFSGSSDLSEVDKIYARYEFLSLNDFESDLFKKEIEETKEQIINYFNGRIQETKNPHLLAKYNHFLLYITRNNNYAAKAIDCYQEVLSYYLSIHNQGFNTLYFSEILSEIILLSTKYKINENKLKNQIEGYLKESSLSSKIKTFILEIIGRNEHKLFKNAELLNYPQLCIDIATNEDDTNIKERLLKIAVLLAQKVSNRELGKIANEMLGDLEYSHILPPDKNNIAISHLNENHYNKIINYYRLAGQKDKVTIAIKEFEENKKHHRYIKIQSKIPIKNAQQIYEALNEYIEHLLNNTSEILILQLCFDNGSLLFPSNERVKETVEKQMEQSCIHKYFSSKLDDFNNNTTSVSNEKLSEHQFYDVFLQNHTLPFMVELLNRAINKKKISYFQIKKTLEKAAFGISFDANRGDSVINYTWFSLIDIGIREFFKQLQKAVKMKQSDWRFTIDFLVPKFEAIFREIVENAGGDITRVKENGDSELKPLEDLFASSIIKEIFNEDDIFLFRHTFTKVGWNIRNNVAHGLYKSFDYTLSKAILVFLCILRLNKVTIYIVNSKNKP